VTADGTVAVRATDKVKVDAALLTVSLSLSDLFGLALGDASTQNTATDTVSAYVDHSTVKAGQSITIAGDATETATADATAVAGSINVAGLAGVLATATSDVDGSVQAYAQGGFLSAAGAMNVTATSDRVAGSKAGGFVGGSIAIGILDTAANVGGETLAYIGEG